MALPWFPFDSQEYTARTAHFTTACHGAMILFMTHYWMYGSLPDSEEGRKDLARITPSEDWDFIVETLTGYSVSRDGTPHPFMFQKDWTNPYMDAMRARCEDQYERRATSYRSLSDRRPSAEDWLVIRKRVFARDDYTCAYCGVRGGALECDHKTPIAQGGSNEDTNLTTSCRACNRAKGPRNVEQFRMAQ